MFHEPYKQANDSPPSAERTFGGVLMRVDPRATGFTVPHCARCADPVPPTQAHRRPGPFCAPCIEDIFASAQSYGGEIGELSMRYNAKLHAFA